MATIASALDTVFTPAASDFTVQSLGGHMVLRRRSTSSAPWVDMGEIYGSGVLIVANPVAGAQFMLVAVSGTPTAQADQ
jgi:hypothetical protein